MVGVIIFFNKKALELYFRLFHDMILSLIEFIYTEQALSIWIEVIKLKMYHTQVSINFIKFIHPITMVSCLFFMHYV